MKHIRAYSFFRKFRNVLLGLLLLSVISIFIIHLFVIRWQQTEEGVLPPKTAVVLHAINNNIVSLDIKLPKFITKRGTAGLVKEDILIPTRDGTEINGLLYRPIQEGTYPIILYFHGGAFMEGYGSIYTHENIIRALASRTKSVVVGVEYRVAPHYTFPTAVEDSYDALVWATEHAEELSGDINHVAVVGDSAGGNIATVVAAMAKDCNGPKIAAQVLFYPLTTFLDDNFPSRQKYASGYYLLSRSVMELARDSYAPNEQMWYSPYTSPLLSNQLEGLPPALIVTAEYDPLRDEGEQYGIKLTESGVPVQIFRFNGMMHGFVSFFEVMRGSNYALDQTVTYLQNVFQDKIEQKKFEIQVFNMEEEPFYFQDLIEAYVIAGLLLGKQVISIFLQ